MSPALGSERVHLKLYQESDRARFFALLKDPAVMRHVGGVKTPAEIDTLFDRALGRSPRTNNHIWAICRNCDDAYIRSCCAFLL
ncbi:MAG: GNAT family N-acetyltransferase [Bdellovibrionales bacterium]